LSKDADQPSEMLVSSAAVTSRSVGAVGGSVSGVGGHAAVEGETVAGSERLFAAS
jgi:hypothetical protein